MDDGKHRNDGRRMVIASIMMMEQEGEGMVVWKEWHGAGCPCGGA